jgi:hypothetical protein
MFGLLVASKLILSRNKVVPRDGIEPPTRGFSIRNG